MLDCRQYLFLFTRLHTRSHLLLAGGRLPFRRRATATVVGLAFDAVAARTMARRPGFGLRTRVALDVAEATLWRRVDGSPEPLVALLGVPLAAEAGTRESAASLALPFVHAAIAVLGHRGRRTNEGRMALAIQITAGLGGFAAGRYEVRLRHQARIALNQRIDAQREQQRLAGMNSVAMGADSIVDLLSRTVPLIGAASEQDILARSLTAWKGWLAETSQQQATYLDTALRRWEHHHNQDPDLSADVAVEVDQGDGTILLSHHQARELERLLQAVPLRGKVHVRRADPSRRYRPGLPMRLVVNGASLQISRDPDRATPAIDFGPLALGITGASSFLAGLNNVGSPRRRLWASATGQELTALWAHAQIVRHGHDARSRVLAAAVGTAALQTILVAPVPAGAPGSGGIERLPFIVGLIGPLSQSIFYDSDVPPVLQLASLATLAALVVGGLAITPGEYRWRDVAAALTTPLDFAGPGYFVRRATQAEALSTKGALRDSGSADAERWYDDGRRIVLDLVNAAVADAWIALDRVTTTLPHSLETEARRRLLEAERRLSTLREPGNCALSSGAATPVATDRQSQRESTGAYSRR